MAFKAYLSSIHEHFFLNFPAWKLCDSLYALNFKLAYTFTGFHA